MFHVPAISRSCGRRPDAPLYRDKRWRSPHAAPKQALRCDLYTLLAAAAVDAVIGNGLGEHEEFGQDGGRCLIVLPGDSLKRPRQKTRRARRGVPDASGRAGQVRSATVGSLARHEIATPLSPLRNRRAKCIRPTAEHFNRLLVLQPDSMSEAPR